MSQAYDPITSNNNTSQDQPPSHHIHGSSERLPSAGAPDQTSKLYDPENGATNPGSAHVYDNQQQNTGDLNQSSNQHPRPTGAFPGGHEGSQPNTGDLNQNSDQYPRPTGAFPGGHSGSQQPGKSENLTAGAIANTGTTKQNSDQFTQPSETFPKNDTSLENQGQDTGSFHHGRHHPPTTGILGTNTGANETQPEGDRDTSRHEHRHHHAAEDAALGAGAVGAGAGLGGAAGTAYGTNNTDKPTGESGAGAVGTGAGLGGAAGTAYGTNNTDRPTGESDTARSEHHHHHHHHDNDKDERGRQRDVDRTPDQSLDKNEARQHQATGVSAAGITSGDKELKHGGPGHRHAHHGYPQEENRAFSSAKNDSDGRDVTRNDQNGQNGADGLVGGGRDGHNASTENRPLGAQPAPEGGVARDEQEDLSQGKASLMDKIVGKTQKICYLSFPWRWRYPKVTYAYLQSQVIGKVKGDQDMREAGELRQSGGKAAVQGLAQD